MADCMITQYHGDTWVEPFAITDSLGAVVNLTGATIVFTLNTESATVANFYFSNPALVTPNTAGISIVRQDLLGTFTLTLTSTLMETLSPMTQYRWDVTTISGGGVVLTYLLGLLAIEGKADD